MYVLKLKGGGKYVAKSGYSYAYTNHIEKIRKFATKEEAEQNCCTENEIIIPIEEV